MNPLNEKKIRASFVNASRREAAPAPLPDLDAVDWERQDYLGWVDAKSPLSAYAVFEVDGEPTVLLLRSSTPGARGRRAALCAWCEDVTAPDDVTLYVARRAGAAGRHGNTLGTLVCTGFTCSANVRRRPTFEEAGGDDEAVRAAIVERRVAGLRERSARFVAEVLSTR